MTSIKLMVPEKFNKFSYEFSESGDSKIQVEFYSKFSKKIIGEISKEKFILLLDITEFKQHIGNNKKFLTELLVNGKIILLVNEQELKTKEIPMVRGVDLMDSDPGEDLFNFKIRKSFR